MPTVRAQWMLGGATCIADCTLTQMPLKWRSSNCLHRDQELD